MKALQGIVWSGLTGRTAGSASAGSSGHDLRQTSDGVSLTLSHSNLATPQEHLSLPLGFSQPTLVPTSLQVLRSYLEENDG